MTERAAIGVLCIGDVGIASISDLVHRLGLEFELIIDGAPIPGSFWGDAEAGIIGTRILARADTPVHSLLHELCHVLVAAPERRASIHTDASDSVPEENATCYLQLLLADAIPGFGFARACQDMDAWGYTFRLGSARAWFEHDAEDARALLLARADLAGFVRSEATPASA
ncbi:hypothetical protein C7S18_18205 [Ahniella affigens]|uniref:Uncharacterized protein n=1 Tax=Ahniella affigens TaxID=2021234 RepID=A0A2P1PVV8_9GAMM|nr:hypothetical protein [Ahniella affigens]AVP98988.1 hypothetical protein C7S18_18205 [Ahniella affigens]